MRLNDTATGILVALGAVFLINLPLWQGVLTAGELSRPDIVIESSDEEFYLTRIREASDGHPWLGHPYLYERRDQRYPLGNLWEALLGGGMTVLGMDIKTVSLLADAVFPFLLALLLWTAVRPVLPEKRWRILLISILFLGFEMHWWKRPISPQATTILPLLYLWALLLPARGKLWLTAVRSVLIGLMMHSYPFHWTYCLVAEGLLTLLLLWRDQSWKGRGLRMLAVSLPLIIVAIPWLQMTLAMRGNPDYPATLTRLGMLDRRFPAGLPLQMWIALAGAATLWFRRTGADKRTGDVLIILLLAGLVVLNQMLITGKEAEFSSHYRQIIFFPLWIAALWSLRAALMRWQNIQYAAVIAGMLIIAVQTVAALQTQIALYEARRTDPGRDERMTLLNMLAELPDQQVILTGDTIGRDLTVYTPHYPFFVFETHMYLTDDATLWRRAAVQQGVIPGYKFPARALVGSSYLNKALHERTICRISALFKSGADCDREPESYLPGQWQKLQTEVPSPAESIAVLREAGVTYALLKDIPSWLQPYGTERIQAGDYTLLRLDWSRP